jgi:hypothetical protein
LLDQPGEKALGSLGVTASLNQNVENIAFCVNCPPEPEFLSADRDGYLIDVPLVVWLWSVPANAVGKMTAKAIDPKTNGFPADNYATLAKKVFHIRCAESKPVIHPHCVGDNLTRKTKPLQAGKMSSVISFRIDTQNAGAKQLGKTISNPAPPTSPPATIANCARRR